MSGSSDPRRAGAPSVTGWRRFVYPVAALALAAAGVFAGLQLLNALLHQHEIAMSVTKLRTEVTDLAVVGHEAEGRRPDARIDDLNAARDALLTDLRATGARLPESEAEILQAEVQAYVSAVETTVADGATDVGDSAAGRLRRSVEAQLDRLVADAEQQAQRSASAARHSLRLILATTFVGVAGFAVLGAGVERQAGAQRESTRLDARFQAIVENLQEFVLIVDDDGSVRYVSPSVEAALPPGFASDSMTGLLERVPSGSREDIARLLADPASTGPVLIEAVDADDDVRYIEVLASDQRDNPHVAGFVITARDVTERVLLERRLRHQATTDELTGLPNRRALNAASGQAIARARRRGSMVGVVLVDLDDFKGINDTMGHAVGDDLLLQVAHRLGAACRGQELVARQGGDEFAVLLEDISGDTEAVAVARRLGAAIQTPFELDDNLVAVHASFGISVGDASFDFDDLLRQADVALFEAKERGRSQYVVYEAGMDHLMQAEMRLRREMASGFASGEFTLDYQPQVDVRSGRPTGLEALMRWNSSVLGEVSPVTFIPVAERSGMIIELGLWALRTACRQLVEWQGEDLPDQLTMSVNVSMAQLQERGFVDQVTRIIEETGILPTSLILEVTESILAQHPTETAAVLTRFRDLGVKVSLDDFGSGYSSMNQLQRLPVDEIKIDREFVRVLSDGAEGARSMVDTLVALGRTLQLRTVAEGIEEVEQLRALQALQCDVAQGFLFARPMPPFEALDFLRSFVSPVGGRRPADLSLPGTPPGSPH